MRAIGWFLGCGAALALGVACSSGKSTDPSAPAPDPGGGDGGTSSGQGFYSPVGCAYSVTPPAFRGFQDLALDDTSAPAGDATPARVRIGLGGGTTHGAPSYADATTTVAFTWETAGKNNAAKARLGTDPSALTDVHTGYSWTTPPPLIGDKNPAFMHEVHACGLKPGTTYYYQVGGGPAGQETWSATQSFTTVPSTGKVIVGVLGDARDVVTTWQEAQGRMRDAAVSVQFLSGDVVITGSVESLYTQWLDAIWKSPQDPTKFWTLGQQLIIPIAGNHENEAAQFYANFAIPGDDPNYAEQFASMDIGNTHFVLVDDQPLSQDGSSAGDAILAWLDKDLAAANANRSKVPFIVSISHRGLFSTSLHATDGDVLDVRGKLAPIYDKYGVDLVFNGHDHEYERSKPLHAGSPASGDPVVGAGTQYVICAGAGANPYAVGTTASPFRAANKSFGNGTAYIGLYGLLTLEGNTLTLTSYGLKASGTKVADDDVIDTLTITH